MLSAVFYYMCLPIAIIIYIIIAMLFEIFDLKKKNQILQEEYEKAILREKRLSALATVLAKELRKGVILNHSNDFNKDIEDAVKLAMKVSHPDNGGNPANFIRFQKLYISVKSKGRE